MRGTRRYSTCAVPALSLPCGVGRSGLPIGMQVVAARYEDARVLHAAAAMKRSLGLCLEAPMLLG
nr:amidase family protein [Pseudomonas typographi]